MKIEVNLSEFYDEDGEQVSTSFKDEIFNAVLHRVTQSVDRALDKQLGEMITNLIQEKVTAKMDELIPALFDYEFTETTSWGEQKGTYTVRGRILKAIEEQTVYKERSYSSDNNCFTRTVNDLFEKKMTDLKKQVSVAVDEKFTKEVLAAAEEKLKKRLGIKE